MIHTKRVDVAWSPGAGWRVELSRRWGAKLFGFQLGYLCVAVWR